VFCNHSCPFDNVAVEGFKSICNTAAGSGAGFGLRAISGGSALGADAQALNASKISTSNGVAHRLGSRERIAVLLGFLGVCGFAGRCLLLGFECGGGTALFVLRDLQLERAVFRALTAQLVCLPCQRKGQNKRQGADDLVSQSEHFGNLHQYHHMASRIGLIQIPLRRLPAPLRGV